MGRTLAVVGRAAEALSRQPDVQPAKEAVEKALPSLLYSLFNPLRHQRWARRKEEAGSRAAYPRLRVIRRSPALFLSGRRFFPIFAARITGGVQKYFPASLAAVGR